MQIITLTTDMGTTDHYVASLKGKLLTGNPAVQIVDISHDISAFDFVKAATILQNCFYEFPVGTIHLIGVDAEPVVNFNSNEGCMPSILKYKGHFFIGNDNGFFSILLNGAEPEEFWRLDDVLSNVALFKFFAKDVFVPIALKIANGEDFNNFASPHDQVNRVILQLPTIEPNVIKGVVVDVDNYGNLITNITKELFFQMGGDQVPFSIYMRRKEYYIDQISSSYNSVTFGEKVAIFNSNNLLEIAINRAATSRNGGANNLFGLGLKDVIRIEFTPQGSRNSLEELF